jgi:hypothetical protein
MLHDKPLGTMAIPIQDTVAEADEDDLDDVFGSESGSPAAGGYAEWSDIPRVREKHETEGYRDGITKGKAESVQKGFDEGYGLGAIVGLRVGKMLGFFEGLHSALAHTNAEEGWGVERERIRDLLDTAQRELRTAVVFGREYWSEDGTWRYGVEEEEEGKEATFQDVAASHPLIKKWESIMAGEIKRWGLNMDIMEQEHEDNKGGKEPLATKIDAESTTPGKNKELSW